VLWFLRPSLGLGVSPRAHLVPAEGRAEWIRENAALSAGRAPAPLDRAPRRQATPDRAPHAKGYICWRCGGLAVWIFGARTRVIACQNRSQTAKFVRAARHGGDLDHAGRLRASFYACGPLPGPPWSGPV
jgi:hypothetical protein